MSPQFNDGFYFKTIQQWEDEVVPARARSELLGWSIRLLPAALVLGGVVAGRNWKLWIAVFVGLYMFISVFTFLDELNENIRFVRHQLWAFRYAVRRVSAEVAQYKNPQDNFNLYAALTSLDREWEDPE